MQAAEPGESLYVPAPHASHVPPSGPVYPALHRQLAVPRTLPEKAGHDVHSVDPGAALYVPLEQPAHSLEPGESLYLPATQASHVPPSGPVYPALHVHRLAASLPSGESANAGHAWQSTTAPSCGEYLPALQRTQSDTSSWPPDVRYVPAGHSEHVDSFWAASDGEYLPAPHLAQAAEPGESLYVPAPHASHAPPSGPVYPALHWQILLPSSTLESE